MTNHHTQKNHRARKYLLALLLLLLLAAAALKGLTAPSVEAMDDQTVPLSASVVTELEENAVPLAVLPEDASAAEVSASHASSAAKPAASKTSSFVSTFGEIVEIQDEPVPLTVSPEILPEELVLTDEIQNALDILAGVQEAEREAGLAGSAAADAAAKYQAAQEAVSQAQAERETAQEALKAAEALAAEKEAALEAAQTAKDSTAAELAQAEKDAEAACTQAQQAAEEASAKAEAAQEASSRLESARQTLAQAEAAAEEASAKARQAAQDSKLYDAIAVLEKGITESDLNALCQESKNQDYFDFTNALNSNGANFAYTMNKLSLIHI